MFQFLVTKEQLQAICDYYGKDPNTLQDYEKGELIDRLIDEFLYSY